MSDMLSETAGLQGDFTKANTHKYTHAPYTHIKLCKAALKCLAMHLINASVKSICAILSFHDLFVWVKVIIVSFCLQF